MVFVSSWQCYQIALTFLAEDIWTFEVSIPSPSLGTSLELSEVTFVTVGPTPGLPIALGVRIELPV